MRPRAWATGLGDGLQLARSIGRSRPSVRDRAWRCSTLQRRWSHMDGEGGLTGSRAWCARKRGATVALSRASLRLTAHGLHPQKRKAGRLRLPLTRSPNSHRHDAKVTEHTVSAARRHGKVSEACCLRAADVLHITKNRKSVHFLRTSARLRRRAADLAGHPASDVRGDAQPQPHAPRLERNRRRRARLRAPHDWQYGRPAAVHSLQPTCG